MTAFQPRWWQITMALLIIGLALALRTQVIFERAASDPRFIPPPLSDSDAYYQLARGLLNGTFPQRPYDYQPGALYVYAALMAVVGQSIPMLRLALAGLDSVIVVGFVIGAGWLLTRRGGGGLLAGLLAACYPVSVFYGGLIFSETIAVALLSAVFFVILWQRQQLVLWRTVLLGLLVGYLFATRSQLAPLAALWLLYLAVLRPGWRVWLRHAAALAFSAGLMVAPFTLWNWTHGELQLTAGGGWWQLYSGTNRDGDGTGGRSVAYDAEDYHRSEAPWRDALLRDILIDPARFGGLLLRKAALFFSEAEPGNNEDFFVTRYLTPLLQTLPLITFRHLVLLGIPGLALLYGQDRRLALLFGGVLLWLLCSIILTFALSRFRYPAVIPMFLLVSVTLVAAWEALRSPAGRARFGPARRWIVPALLTAFLVWFPVYALTGSPPPVPPKRILTALPPDARPLNVTYGDAVILHGWRYAPYTRWWPAAEQGWQQPGYPYAVELFWSVAQPTTEQYQFYIALFLDDARYGELDRALGTVSHPPKTTEAWQPGEIYSELVAFRIAPDAPQGRSGAVLVGVYRKAGAPDAPILSNLPVTAPPGVGSVALHTLAVFDLTAAPALPAVLPGTAWTFGTPGQDQLRLHGYDLPAQAAPGTTLDITFYWEAQTDLTRDYTLFLHVVDAAGMLVTQGDNALQPGLFTSNWPPAYAITSTLPLPLPTTPGTYRVYSGVIDAISGERLSTNTADGRVLLGEVTISPP